ncbi:MULTISPECIES: hypothetical protein [Paraburkholderia]|uniref:Uncharacterized protein n=1 Tax=Paraburkholderia podalyriae TaxID=1938811 RepID=A0ABR7PYC5_9BURK|nr:hypothetical protein [Paraburkholderia podalyriae]MBC8751289.1 hypothetical protein [Paraburkholderia podalyriae]
MDWVASGLDGLTSLLAAVPNVVWSGIVGSLITVIGVLVTNFGLSRRHREQLQHTAEENARKLTHDASESALDRKMKLKRDVYIPAIEAVYSATSSFGALADPSNLRSDIQQNFVEAVGSISKVNAVGSLESVAAVGALLQRLLSVNLELSVKRNAIEVVYGQLQANARTVTRAVEEHGRWVQVQTSMLFEGPPVPEKWNFVANQIGFQQGQINLWTAKQTASSRELQLAQLAFLRVMAKSQPKLTDASITASVALRDELGMLDGSQGQLRQTLAENGELARKALEEAIARAEQEIGKSERWH